MQSPELEALRLQRAAKAENIDLVSFANSMDPDKIHVQHQTALQLQPMLPLCILDCFPTKWVGVFKCNLLM